jgi:hypothetical protein
MSFVPRIASIVWLRSQLSAYFFVIIAAHDAAFVRGISGSLTNSSKSVR